MNTSKSVLIYCTNSTGHFPSYIKHLLTYYTEQHIADFKVYFLTSLDFRKKHSFLNDLEKRPGSSQIEVKYFTDKERKELSSIGLTILPALRKILRSFKEWKILKQYLIDLKITSCVILNLDALCLPLMFSEPSQSSISGIYYRPVSHYKKCFSVSFSSRRKFWVVREKLFLSHLFRAKAFKTLFCLDPLAVKYFSETYYNSKAVYLPDPSDVLSEEQLHTDETTNLRNQLKINSERIIFLLFGSISERKGVYKILEALNRFPDSECENICLIIAGKPQNGNIEEVIDLQCKEIISKKSIQIICEFKYLSDAEIAAYFTISNVILTLYQEQIGMSGVLLLAAAYKKPVLSSNYGLIGEVVRNYELGLTVDASTESEIIGGLQRFISSPKDDLCNETKMEDLVQENSIQNFAKTIFKGLE